jgi:hypothetical protein
MVDTISKNSDQLQKEPKSDDLPSLCQKLDKCAIEYVECYGQILTQRALMEESLNDAYLNMSKARSLIGCTSLSSLQIPPELTPHARVELNDDDSDYDQFNLVFGSNTEQKDDAKSLTCSPFPKWFGVLAPLSLKTSHKAFSRSLNMAVSLCELQSKLKSLEKEYKQLMSEKQRLLD